MESVGDIATVTVHIKKIREKIEFNTAKLSILRRSGVWGTGLRCEPVGKASDGATAGV